MFLQIPGLTLRTLNISIPLLKQDNKSSHKLETEKEIKRSSFPVMGMLQMNSSLEGGEDIPHLQAFPGKGLWAFYPEPIPSRLHHGTVNMEIMLLYSLVSILFPMLSTAIITWKEAAENFHGRKWRVILRCAHKWLNYSSSWWTNMSIHENASVFIDMCVGASYYSLIPSKGLRKITLHSWIHHSLTCELGQVNLILPSHH